MKKKLFVGKKLIALLIALMMVFSLTACGGGDSDGDEASDTDPEVTEEVVEDEVDSEEYSALAGSYICTGSDMQGTKLDPADEWMELNDDGTGTWFLGATEDTFAWTVDGDEINFAVDVENSETKMPYTGLVEGDQITLDTGMLYYFTKE